MSQDEGSPPETEGGSTRRWTASERVRRVQRTLQERERTLDTLLDNLPGMAFRCRFERGWPMEFVSRGCEELTGFPVEVLLAEDGRLFGERIHADDHQRIEAEVIDAVADRHPFVIEYRILHADGEERWIWERGRAVRDGEERVIALEGFATDVTGRRRLEQQLQAAQKMEAVGRLAGGIAHDFNNNLAVILGSAALAKKALPRDSDALAELEEVLKAGRRAADLTRQLLAFSRQQVLEPRVLDLNREIAKLEKMLRRLIGEDVDLHTSLGDRLGRVRADPGQLQQVLMNLAVNARDAMPRGGRLTIETSNVELDAHYAGSHVAVIPGEYVLLAVTDSGIGMDETVRHQVFDPFFTTKGWGEGTGLGLSMVYGIVKQSGGNIWVYSEPGRGTTFKIYLPRVSDPHQSEEGLDFGIRYTNRPATILLVEDEEGVRQLMERLLTMAGHAVVGANGAAAALRVMQERRGEIDLLLTDVVMPDGTGPELYAFLQKEFPDLRVLLMSGYAGEAIVRHGILENGVPFISKPFTPSDLLKKIQEALRRPSSPLPSED